MDKVKKYSTMPSTMCLGDNPVLRKQIENVLLEAYNILPHQSLQ